MIAVPLLLVLLNPWTLSATGLALGVVAVSSLSGSVQRIGQREDPVDTRNSVRCRSGAITAPMGRLLATQISPQALTAGFSALSLLIALRMLWQSIHDPQNSVMIRAGRATQQTKHYYAGSVTQQFDCWRFNCMAGLTSGGVLTGPAVRPVRRRRRLHDRALLNQLNGVSMRSAVATSWSSLPLYRPSRCPHRYTLDGLAPTPLLGIGGVGACCSGSLLARWLAGVYLA
ncbi:MAG: TSUP family transporter [Haliea sp.]|nr:TSUP family transporter [Haliea sp.]